MDLGIHLPLMQFGDEGLSLGRLEQAVDAAREGGLTAVSANDHFIFSIFPSGYAVSKYRPSSSWSRALVQR